MAGIRALIGLSFAATAGITFLVLGCVLPNYNNWWPMFVLIFYATSPVPSIISRRYADAVEASNVLVEVCLFITTGIVISAYGLPIILGHLSVIKWGACGFILAGNTAVFSTILAYFIVFNEEDPFSYSTW